jgi:Clp amino terminal domain, pathogenicity island component
MFERFTDRARTAVILARTEASERGDQIRPVYMLHAVASGSFTAARVLADLGVAASDIERRLDRTAPLRHSYIGTEHLLLGLLRAAERNPRGDFSSETVSDLGIDPAQVRQRILDELRRTSA